MPLHCPACSAVNPDTATFCNNCGARLLDHASTDLPQQPADKPDILPEERPQTPPVSDGSEIDRPLVDERPSPAGGGWKPSTTPSQPASVQSSPPPPHTPPTTQTQKYPAPSGVGIVGKIILLLILGVASLAALYVVISFVYALLSGVGGINGDDFITIGAIGLAGWLASRGVKRIILDLNLLHGGEGTISGEARAVKERREENKYTPASWFLTRTWTIWTFRVERYGDSGNRLTPVPVQMRGLGFTGAINEGDRVEVAGPWREGHTLRVKQVRNLTTGATVSVKRDWVVIFITWGIPLLLVACLVLIATLIQ